MKFPESWLKEFVDVPQSGAVLAHVLTMAGLESEELLFPAPPFDHVVVAKVKAVEKHPDADRLNVCQVDVGDGVSRQIVCGAPNVQVGMTVPCALPGAVLPGGLTIRVAKVRGVESSGMLCSASELGLSDEASGLYSLADDLEPGRNVREVLLLDDPLHVLKLTPNRGDCLSILGIAREVSALGAVPLLPVKPIAVSVAPEVSSRSVVLDAPEACPRYFGRVFSDVNAKATTPDWMRRRLERSGVRSISALVDITNYVMLEFGQPLHVFDNARLDGTIHVRYARPGESLLLLNGETLQLAPDVLVIADDSQVLAMAGVMGGEGSGVSLESREVFLESAFFAPKAIAGRARRYGFASDASHRFERGVDFEGARRALDRASELILQICGGRCGQAVEALAALPSRPPVRLRLSRLGKILGVTLSSGTVLDYFSRLGFECSLEAETIIVVPPSYRFDIEIEEDLIEEIARLHGYDNIPVTPPKGRLSMLPQTESQCARSSVRSVLVGLGYQETINFAFVDEVMERNFSANDPSLHLSIRLANPIASQMSVMRSTLMGGLVANLVTNQRRKQPRVRLFELGRCFVRSDDGGSVAGFSQPWTLGLLAWGGASPEQWGEPLKRVDFFDLKGDVETLIGRSDLEFVPAMHPALHPGRSAWVYANGARLGVLGELHPRWVQEYDLSTPPVLAEFLLDGVLSKEVPAYQELSSQPAVVRDLALVVEKSLSSWQLMEAMKQSQPSLVRDIKLFDVYSGAGVGEGKKSLAFRIVMQDTQKTLQDAEVDGALQVWVAALDKSVGAKLRA